MISRTGSIAKYFFIDLFGSVVYFPAWWYTVGFWGVLRYFGQALSYRWTSYRFHIWLKNFFVPMYGQEDWSGRLVSVFMRFFVLLGRLIAYAIEAAIYFLFIIFWLLAPPLCLIFFLQSLYRGIV
ncbi:MAG: hypothetical protein Q7N87_03180 [Candidatus Uhrbacteria bacterium]|nr:hypothetical protein [Candidatus Uhrbacteria bacterium]